MGLRVRWSRWSGLGHAIIGFAAVMLVLEVVHGRGLDWFRWRAAVEFNPALLEGYSWWFGRFSLPHSLWDTAYVARTGRVYNVFPPLQSIIGYVATALSDPQSTANRFPELQIVPLVLFGLPLPLVGYAVFRRRVGSDAWAAVLTLGWLGGTAVLPCIEEARNNGVHHINHLLSQVGLLLLAGELLREPERRRWWVALLGLLIAAWSRQLTIVYGIALLAAAWTPGATESSTPVVKRSGRGRRLAMIGAGVVLILAVPMGLNRAKFGSPLESGYELIYAGRDTNLARRVREHGLFSTAFAGRNAYYMNAALPWGRAEAGEGIGWRPSPDGASIWLTTPILVLIVLGASYWWREGPGRMLMLCTVPIIVALLLYHNTGYRQYGYYRFALDFVPVWFVVGGRWLTQGRRRWATVACVAWSVGYFAMVSRWSGALVG